MELQKIDEGNAGRLRVEGEMTIYTANADREALLKALDGGAEMEWSLSGVTEIDTAGAQLLIAAKREAAGRGADLSFTEHSAPVVEVIEQLRLSGLLGDPLVLTGGEADAKPKRRRTKVAKEKTT